MAAMMALTIVGCGGNNTVALQSDKAEETTKADSDATHLVLTTSALDPEVAPDYNPWADGLLKFKEEVEKNSNGRYVVDIYWYSSYASDAESFQMIQDGETDFNFGAGMSNVDKRFAWQRIPFLLPDLDTVGKSLLIRMQKDLLLIQSFMKKMELNFWHKTVAYSATSFRQIN